jgi:hypothetical protein
VSAARHLAAVEAAQSAEATAELVADKVFSAGNRLKGAINGKPEQTSTKAA